MQEKINYAVIAGSFEGIISTLAYSLCSKGLADYSKYECIKEYLDSEIARVKAKPESKCSQ